MQPGAHYMQQHQQAQHMTPQALMAARSSMLQSAPQEAAERLVVDDFLIFAWMLPVEESQVGASKIYEVQGEVKGEEEALEARVVMEVKPFT
ncbi:hypothetical protein OIU78_022756 [Salix suchowensis]|nr:hypothetical protein OIU78_022756 [Salix suchowensis]